MVLSPRVCRANGFLCADADNEAHTQSKLSRSANTLLLTICPICDALNFNSQLEFVETFNKLVDVCIRREIDDNFTTAILAALDCDILREELLELLNQTAV